MPDLVRHLVITGRVQGVAFRQSMCREAERLGVRGWVRNRRNGSVEAFATGPEPAVIALLHWARHGPPGAQVDQIEIDNPEPVTALPGGFDCLPTT